MKLLVKEMMDEKGLSIDEVVRLSGLSTEIIIRCINNDLSLPFDVLENIALEIDCSIYDLFDSPYKESVENPL